MFYVRGGGGGTENCDVKFEHRRRKKLLGGSGKSLGQTVITHINFRIVITPVRYDVYGSRK